MLGLIDNEIKSFGSHEFESLPPEVQLYHCFAASALWSHLQDMINRRLPHDVVRCEMRELELLRFIFALAFYNTLPSCVFAYPEA